MEHIEYKITLHAQTTETADAIRAKIEGPNAGQSPSKVIADTIQRSDVSFTVEFVSQRSD